MYRFQEILDSTLSDIFADKEYEKDLEDLDGKVSRVISEVADEAAEGMLVTIKAEGLFWKSGESERSLVRSGSLKRGSMVFGGSR